MQQLAHPLHPSLLCCALLQVLTLNFTFGGPEMVARWASYPYVRLYNVPQYQSSNTPLNESQSLSYPGWATVNPTSLIAYPGDYSTYFSSVCFFTGAAVYDSLKGEVPIGLVQSSYGGTSAEAWTSADALGNCGPYNPGPNPPTYMLATVVYNAMMHPLLRVALTAVVWYHTTHTHTRTHTHTHTHTAHHAQSPEPDISLMQVLSAVCRDTRYQGESNGGALLPRYTCAFPNLIDNWRDKFHQPDLPWFFALLAPYASGGTGLPPLRIAQLSGLTRPRTWVANAIDLGDEQSARTDIRQIHSRTHTHVPFSTLYSISSLTQSSLRLCPDPRNKSYLGERLARHIRRELYGQEVVASGPNVSSVTATLSGSTVMVQLTYQPGPESDGLHAISTPNCTTINGGAMAGPCCTFADGGRSVTGLFYAQVDGQPANSAARPVAAIGSSRLTANVTFATAPRVGQQLMVRVAWSQYPGCVLYNNQLLPALPSIHNVTIGPGGPVDPVVTSSSTGDAAVVVSSSSAGGSDAVSSGSAATGEAVTSTGAPTPMTSSSTGDGDDDGSSSSMMLMLGAVVVVVVLLLVVMGALVWRRQQQRASEAGGAANGYTSMGDTDGTSRR